MNNSNRLFKSQKKSIKNAKSIQKKPLNDYQKFKLIKNNNKIYKL